MKVIASILLFITIVNAVGFFEKHYPLAEEIVSHMTLDQKIGQTIQIDFAQMNFRSEKTEFQQIQEYLLGSVLVGGNGCPDGEGNVKMQDNYYQASKENWQNIATTCLQSTIDVKTPEGDVKIKLLLGTDAVHGNQHVLGEILFPHNIGLAASHNPDNFANAAKWNKISVLDSGFNFVFAPTVAVSHNFQWGRFYETMGTDTDMISQYAKAYVTTLQEIDGDYLNGALASTKHFLGDGATYNGNDEGNNKVYDMATFLEHNLKGYNGALEVNTGNIMVSYSAINDHEMSINSALLQGLLKDKLGFDGFLISDYDAVGKVSAQGKPSSGVKMPLKQAYLMSLSAGLDMMMLAPKDDEEVYKYINIVKELLKEGELHEARINDAVKRILAVKLAMRLVDVPAEIAAKHNYNSTVQQKTQVYSKEDEYADSLQAAQESLVLLENENDLLPLNPDGVKYVVLVGERTLNVQGQETVYQDFENIGAQNGGWSIRWQGYEGNLYWSGLLQERARASSVVDGLNTVLAGKDVQFIRATYNDFKDKKHISEQREVLLAQLKQLSPDMNKDNTVIVGILAESPYAEFMGEINSKYCKDTTASIEGCLYNAHQNEYLPLQQKTTLELNFDSFSKSVINLLRTTDKDIPLVTVLFSGRPMIVNEALNESQAFVAAWLPGTQGGEAVANSLFGVYQFRNQEHNERVNTLPVSWLKTMDSLVNFPVYDGTGFPTIKDPLFEAGFGLSTKRVAF